MNWNKKLFCVAKRADAEEDVSVFFDFIGKEHKKKKFERKQAKMTRKRNRKK